MDRRWHSRKHVAEDTNYQLHEHALEGSEESLENPENRTKGTLVHSDSLPPELHNQIYEWYRNAIERRDREPLGEESFRYTFFKGGARESTKAFGDEHLGFLLGDENHGRFFPSHFAPRTLRGGYELMQKLGRSDIPAVLSITPDLARTLEKMPEWKTVDLGIETFFHGGKVKKIIAHNRHPKIQEIAFALLGERAHELFDSMKINKKLNN